MEENWEDSFNCSYIDCNTIVSVSKVKLVPNKGVHLFCVDITLNTTEPKFESLTNTNGNGTYNIPSNYLGQQPVILRSLLIRKRDHAEELLKSILQAINKKKK